jgi:hypothetical protein
LFCFSVNVGDNAPARTEDPDNQTNDITNGEVYTGRDARTVRFVFVSICCGVARLTNLGYLNSQFNVAGRCTTRQPTGVHSGFPTTACTGTMRVRDLEVVEGYLV